ncbi:MAG: phosphonate ABC transporter, permease protein PhnE [Actinobacteria bacterium]|nr:phosphonate ABC transporter, permease protein PhnE [Actinomycetota bacterium]
MTVPDLGIRPDAVKRPDDPLGPKLFRAAIFVAILVPAIWSATGLQIDWPSLNPFRWVTDWEITLQWSWPYLILVAIVGLTVYWLSKRLTWSAAAAAAVLVMPWLNIWNEDFFFFDIWNIVHRLAPPDLSAEAVQRALPKVMESIFIAWVGTMIGAFFSFPLAFLAAKNMTPPWVNTGIRQVLNAIRAVPELLVAMLLIPITGLGAWTGTMALGLHSIGTLGKLSSEVVEGIDGGPVEAVGAVGGGQVARIRFAVIPQVLPTIVAYWLYRFEINIRASAVLGVVGAGGIGAELVAQLKFRDFARAGTVLFLTVGAVLIVDTISARLRRRIISGEPEPSPLTNFLGRTWWQRGLALLGIGIVAGIVVFLLRQLQVDLSIL